ncbi:glycosyltransferase [Geobacter pelophilus]|uniref:Glycosyltransferase n=1 Tax=Geoanaerobacter pelophilus TaxID=60036 RepID=A0AAW4L4P9_9BACT|nr:glycosyltransferase [Geoanaerobacter pelophilus]MBT0666184.1 glycosyltransferase [Geoanaerobacter pelophilus]
MKILISAFACHPAMGSEDGVGWGWVTTLARYHQLHVITREYRRADIEAELETNPVNNLYFHYIDPPAWMIFWKKGSRNFMAYALLWQLFALVMAVRLSIRQRFDIVQHLTYGNLWLPTFLFFVPGTYIWGPVGGGVVPAVFAENYRIREWLVENLRLIVLKSLKWLNLPALLNMWRARLILVRTWETLDYLPLWARKKAILVPETALDPGRFPYSRKERRDTCCREMFNIVYAGRIMSLKNLHLAVTAFRELLARNPLLAGFVRFDIYGDGPYLPVCRELAGDEAGRAIIFHGFVDRAVLLEKLREAHLFIHLSVKDTAATAPMEAMALGIPVICVKAGGMMNLVDDTCGVPLEQSSPELLVPAVINELKTLVTDRERLFALSCAARAKVEQSFSWERRIEQYNEIVKRELSVNR